MSLAEGTTLREKNTRRKMERVSLVMIKINLKGKVKKEMTKRKKARILKAKMETQKKRRIVIRRKNNRRKKMTMRLRTMDLKTQLKLTLNKIRRIRKCDSRSGLSRSYLTLRTKVGSPRCCERSSTRLTKPQWSWTLFTS